MSVPLVTNRAKGLSCLGDGRRDPLAMWVYNTLMKRSEITFDKIYPFLENKILDIGSGNSSLVCLLKRKGFNVEAIDVKDFNMYEDIKVKLYDGQNIPYPSNSFDTALLIGVLHHCSDQVKVLKEAVRVSNRVVIIEDVFRNYYEKQLVSLNDMLGNFEFYSHTYRTTDEWSEILEREGSKISHIEEWSQFKSEIIYCRHCLIVAEKH